MKKISKYSLIGFGLLLGVGVLSSCTASFCSVEDTAKILYTFDRGVTKYSTEAPAEGIAYETDTGLIEGVTVYKTYDYKNSAILRDEILPKLNSNGYYLPSIEFFKEIDNWVLKNAMSYNQSTISTVGEISTKQHDSETNRDYYVMNYDTTTLYGTLNKYGYYKFFSDAPEIKDQTLFSRFDTFIDELRNSPESKNIVPGNDFLNFYKSTMLTRANTYRSCIYTVGEDGDLFGMYGDKDLNNSFDQVEITKKDWGYAWGKGFLEGLLIYPIAYMVDSFTTFFAGSNANLISGIGWAQVGAIFLGTIIIRTLMLLITLKQTLAQGKMQKAQPQLAKLQEKYPNSNTNQYEKQRLAQEQMALYKKYKISPFGQIIVLVLQFPIFICVWGALSGSSALATGTFYNMNLSMTVWEVLTNTSGLPGNVNGWWTAFTLIIIMTICQLAATLIPLFIQRIQRKKVAKLGKNNAVNKQNKTMKIVQFVMLAMIIVMGFTLPSAMGIYWIAGALFSIIQTLITYFINNKNTKGGNK